MDRRIAPPSGESTKGILDRLTTKQPGDDLPLFETKQKALMFAAALGWHLKSRKPLSARDSGSAVRFDIFEKARDDGLVAALAVAERDDLGALREESEEEVVTIFEEYAHAGLLELQRRCFESGVDTLEAILGLVADGRHQGQVGEAEGVDAELLRNLMGGELG